MTTEDRFQAEDARLREVRDRILAGEENITPEGKQRQMLLSGGLALTIILGIALAVAFDGGSPSTTEKLPSGVVSANSVAADNDCFSSQDGSSYELVSLITKLQASPGSFRHTRTGIANGKDANHKSVVMEYRSKSNFGTDIFGKAHAILDVTDCSISELNVNER